MTKKQRRDEQILRYGFVLKRTFPGAPTALGPVSLYKRLHRIEAEAHRLAEDTCNRPMQEGEAERREAFIMTRLRLLLGDGGPPVFLNMDPRGYSLKVEEEAAKTLELQRDWGGYGILAPDFE